MRRNMHKGLLIDDEDENKLLPITERCRDVFNFDIQITQPAKLEEDYVQFLSSAAKTKDCIILDWKLDHIMLKSNYKVVYRASELCQFIRRKTAEKNFRALPIFLWSTEQYLKDTSYSDDFTSHDLFDSIYKKDVDLKGKALAASVDEMKYFVGLYEIFRAIGARSYTIEDFRNILGLEKSKIHWVDSRAWEFMLSEGSIDKGNFKRMPIFSKFISQDVVGRSGMLIGEALLATRLGIDWTKSRGWADLVEKKEFREITYKGLFKSEEKKLFWMQGLHELWDKIAPKSESFFVVDAAVKVDAVSRYFNVKGLKPITGKGKYFWYLCDRTGEPLDPDLADVVEGGDKLYSWQDPIYRIKKK